MIDFPQTVSIDHPNAKMYFDRDVECIDRYFRKRYRFIGEEQPDFETDVVRVGDALDLASKASGFDREKERELQQYLRQQRREAGESDDDDDDEDDDDDDDDDDSEDAESHDGDESNDGEEEEDGDDEEPDVSDDKAED